MTWLLLVAAAGLAGCAGGEDDDDGIIGDDDPLPAAYAVDVSLNAQPTLKRTAQWSLSKSSPLRDVVMGPSQVLRVPYTVEAKQTGTVDGGWAVGGSLFLHNPAPVPAQITGIEVGIGGIRGPEVGVLALDRLQGKEGLLGPAVCPPLPFALAAGATIECHYELRPDGPVSGAVYASVTTAGAVGGDVGWTTYDFARATVTPRDACVDVTDDVGFLGRTCKTAAYTYAVDVGPFEVCDASLTYTNKAHAAGADTGTGPAAVWDITVKLPACPPSCTLSQGYWKTHSVHGPAARDATWDLLPAGADTPFFGGASYHDTLWRPTAGNVYYTLARQYIAAYLNVLAGANDDPIEGTLADAHALFKAYKPGEVATWGEGELRTRLLEDADVLDRYNNGLLGPLACSEDETSYE